MAPASPVDTRRSTTLRALALAASFVVPFLVLTLTLDSDVGFWDTGEMNVVPWILGLAHPTGYPTEILLGWAFAHSFPFGTPAFRLSLLNAIEYAFAASIAFAFVSHVTQRRVLGFCAAYGFVTTPLVWTHATHTDVMSLTVALDAAAFFAVWLWRECRRDRYLVGAAIFAGFSAGTHGATIWYLASLVPLIVSRAPYPSRRLLAACAAAFAFVACAVYAYLPIRSAYVVAHALEPATALGLGVGLPFFNYGNPSEARNFFSVVTGAQVAAPHAFARLLDPTVVGRALASSVGLFRAELTDLGAIVGSLALGIVFVRRREFAAIFAIATVGVSLFVASFTSESDPQRYFIFPIWYAWTFAAIGCDTVSRAIRVPALAAAVRVVFTTALLAFVIVRFGAGFGRTIELFDRNAASYAAALERETPDDAIVLAEWTYATPLAYALYVARDGARRQLVPGNIDDFEGPVTLWLRNAPVFAVREAPPQLRRLEWRFVCAFAVNPDPAHDPKLYRIEPTTAAASAFARGHEVPRTPRSANACGTSHVAKPSPF